MRDIANKVDGVDVLPGNEFTDLKNESQNLITSSGLTLTGGDVRQIAKAVAMYSAYGDVYIDVGVANASVLNPIGSMLHPPAYVDGLRVRFKPIASNTGTTYSVRIGSLSVVNVSLGVIGNGDPVTVLPGWMSPDRYIELVYTSTPDGVTKYWLIKSNIDGGDIVPSSVNKLAMADNSVGVDEIQINGVERSAIANDAIGDNELDDISMSHLVSGDLNVGKIHLSQTGLRHGETTEPNASIKKEGISFGGAGSPGSDSPIRFYVSTIESLLVGNSEASWTLNADGTPYGGTTVDDHVHVIGEFFILTSPGKATGIPWTANVIGTTIAYTGNDGKRYDGVAVSLQSSNVSGYRNVTRIKVDNVDFVLFASIDTSLPVWLSIMYLGDSV